VLLSLFNSDLTNGLKDCPDNFRYLFIPVPSSGKAKKVYRIAKDAEAKKKNIENEMIKKIFGSSSLVFPRKGRKRKKRLKMR